MHKLPTTSAFSRESRRAFLSQLGMGFGSIALSSMLNRDAMTRPLDNPLPKFAAKAKSVIWLFMIGGTSHLESFDPKPALNQYAGKDIADTPHAHVLNSPFLQNERVVAFDPNNGFMRHNLMAMQTGYRKRGESGIEISDWWPHVGGCVDDLAIVRSMWTEDSNHGAQLQFHTGRHRVDGFFPTIGSWVNYGLGSLNENLPQFVVMGDPLADCCGGMEAHRANYLGPQYDGIPLLIDSQNPLPYARPPQDMFYEEQIGEFDLLRQLNGLAADQYPSDDSLHARVKSYELAFRMQTAIPEVVRFDDEPEHIRRLYGLDQPETRRFGEQLLASRRLVERGVRFVQVYHGSNGGAGSWDSHSSLKEGHSKLCKAVDQPIAALLKDLKQRGLLDETIVVWATEFGRTPGSQGSGGRDHHPFAFSIWMAGGGLRSGIAHGKTDELGYHAIEDRHYVTDVHATILKQLGLDAHDLTVPGRQRLEKDFGTPIDAIIA